MFENIKIEDYLNEQNIAIFGMVTVFSIMVSVALDYFWPVDAPKEIPQMFKEDPKIASMTLEELKELAERDPNLPLLTLEEVAKHDGSSGKKAWIAVKGVIYDCTTNDVYKTEGGYNCFTGKDATLALGKMQFEFSGKRGWRKKLDREELQVLAEWTKWYEQRYPKVGYLKEEYEANKKKQ